MTVFAKLLSFSLFLTSTLALTQETTIVNEKRDVLLDAIVVGGGPAGLSALSGLARVRRRAILIDSGEYRNGPTRHAHDIIGLDGVTPAYFRWLARDKLSYYDTVSMINGTVLSIDIHNTTDDLYFTANILDADGDPTTFTARSIVLGTGMKDLLPNTPGLQEAWGKGEWWCPWCDGYEHKGQPLGLLAKLQDIPGMVREVSTLYQDIIAFVNGTDTPTARSATDTAFPDWETYLDLNNVKVYNQTILEIQRLRDGADPDADPSLPTSPEYDLFCIELEGGLSLERSAFFTSFPDTQRSTLGQAMGVRVINDRLAGIQNNGYLTNIPLVYAIGDIVVDNVTNIPHAMYSGKKAAVYLHVALARLDVAAELAAASQHQHNQSVARNEPPNLDPRGIWNVMNDPVGDVLHAGNFDDSY